MALYVGFLQAVLENETSSLRFEAFAVDLVSAAEGVRYLPTSRNYDQGRDGRASRSGERGMRIIAATISRTLPKKIEEDVERLRETTVVSELTYCCTQEITEAALDKILDQLRQRLPEGAHVR